MLLIITSDCKSLTDKDPTFICTRKVSRFPYVNKYKYIYNGRMLWKRRRR